MKKDFCFDLCLPTVALSLSNGAKEGVLRVFVAVPSVALAKDGEGLGSEVRTNGQIQLPSTLRCDFVPASRFTAAGHAGMIATIMSIGPRQFAAEMGIFTNPR
jgi:hypothetical protein